MSNPSITYTLEWRTDGGSSYRIHGRPEDVHEVAHHLAQANLHLKGDQRIHLIQVYDECNKRVQSYRLTSCDANNDEARVSLEAAFQDARTPL